MKYETVPIESLQLDPTNVRTHSDNNIAAIRTSYARFGQQKPIVVDADGIVRDGNGQLIAARELGWSKIEIVRTALKGNEATAYAIAANRTAELAEWDNPALISQLAELQIADNDFASIVGFTPDEMRTLRAIAAAKITPLESIEGLCEYESKKVSGRAIIVHFYTTEDVETFAALLDLTITDKTRATAYPKQPHVNNNYEYE